MARYFLTMAYLLLGLVSWTWVVLCLGTAVALVATRGFQGPPPPQPWPGVFAQAAVCTAFSLPGVIGAVLAWRLLRDLRDRKRTEPRGFEVRLANLPSERVS